MTLHRALFAVPLALAFAAAPAEAADSKIGVSFGMHSGSDGDSTDTLVAPRLDVDIGVSDHFGIALTLPFTSLSRTNGNQGTFRFGNPYAGGFWGTDLNVLSVRIGAGIAFPAASRPEEPGERAAAIDAYRTAQGLAGLGEYWLYQPGTTAFVVPAQAEVDLPIVDLRVDVTWAALIPTEEDSEFDTTLQLGGELLIDVAMFNLGARLQGVWLPTQSGDDMQVSVAPLAEVELGPFYARTMFVINLDGPRGFSFDDGPDKFWGWHLGAGFRF